MRTTILVILALACVVFPGCKQKKVEAETDTEAQAAGLNANDPQGIIRISKSGLDLLAVKARSSAEAKAKRNERLKKAGRTVKEEPPGMEDLLKPDMFEAITVYLYYRMDEPEAAAIVSFDGCELEPVFSGDDAAKLVEKSEDGYWSLIQEEGEENPLAEDYVFKKASDRKWLLGPKDMVDSVSFDKLSEAAVTTLNGDRSSSENAFDMTITVPEDFEEAGNLVMKKMQESGDDKNAIANNIAARLFGSIVAGFADQLARFENVSFGLSMGPGETRKGSLYLAFRDEEVGEAAFKGWEAATNDATPTFDVLPKIRRHIVKRGLKPTATFEDGVLSAKAVWNQANDKAANKILRDMILFAAFSSPPPVPQNWTGPVEYSDQRTRDIPTDPRDAETMKRELPTMITSHMYPRGKYDVVLDKMPVSFCNFLRYKVVKAIDKDGTPVELSDKSSHVINDGGSSLDLSPKDKTKTVSKVTLSFQPSIFTGADVYEFTKDTPAGTIKKGKTSLCRLDILEGNAFKVSVEGGHVHVAMPMDATGGVLKRAPGPDGKKLNFYPTGAGTFCGNIDTLKIAVTKEKTLPPFEVEVDFAELDKKRLPKEPTAGVPVRIHVPRWKEHRALTDEELEAIKVSWNAEESRVVITPPPGNYKDSPKGGFQYWKDGVSAYADSFFGSYGNRWESRIRDKDRKDVSQPEIVVGVYSLRAPKRMAMIELVKTADGTTVTKAVDKNNTVSARFNKNQVVLKHVKDGKTITSSWDALKTDWIRVYDKEGRCLKEEGLSFNTAGLCWGMPHKVVLRVPMERRTIVKTFAFATKAGVPATRVQEAKTSFEDLLKLMATARQTINKTDSNHLVRGYGDDFAHRYFLVTPSKRIAKEMACSDPHGAKRFGYDVKPFKGYHFTFPTGVIGESGVKRFLRGSAKETVKYQGKDLEFKKLANPYDAHRVILVPVDKRLPHISVSRSTDIHLAYSKDEIRYSPDGHKTCGAWERFPIDIGSMAKALADEF